LPDAEKGLSQLRVIVVQLEPHFGLNNEKSKNNTWPKGNPSSPVYLLPLLINGK